MGDDGTHVRFVRVGLPPGCDGQDGQLVKAAEEPLETLLGGYKFEAEASFLFARMSPDGSCESLRVAHGPSATAAVRQRAEALAAQPDLGSWLAAAARDGTATGCEPSGADANDVVFLKPSEFETFGLESMLWEGLEEIESFEDLPGDIFTAPFKGTATRPVAQRRGKHSAFRRRDRGAAKVPRTIRGVAAAATHVAPRDPDPRLRRHGDVLRSICAAPRGGVATRPLVSVGTATSLGISARHPRGGAATRDPPFPPRRVYSKSRGRSDWSEACS